MFVKFVLLLCFYIFLIKTVASQAPPNVFMQHITQKDYDGLNGPDLCGQLANNIEALKKACNNAAIREDVIQCGQSLTFKKGYPKCIPLPIQIYDSHGKKANVIHTKLVHCANTVQDFPIGKGKSSNDILMYDCADPKAPCESYYNMPDVFSN